MKAWQLFILEADRRWFDLEMRAAFVLMIWGGCIMIRIVRKVFRISYPIELASIFSYLLSNFVYWIAYREQKIYWILKIKDFYQWRKKNDQYIKKYENVFVIRKICICNIIHTIFITEGTFISNFNNKK